MQNFELLRNRRSQKSIEDRTIYFLLENGLDRYVYTDKKREYLYLNPCLEITSKQGKEGLHGSIMYPMVNMVPGNVKAQIGGSSWVNISGDLFKGDDEYILTRSVGGYLPDDYYDGNNLGEDLAKKSIVFYLSMIFGGVPDITETIRMSAEELRQKYPRLKGANIFEVKAILNKLKKHNILENFDVVVIGDESIETPAAINLIRHTRLPFFAGSVAIEGDNGEMPELKINEAFAEHIYKDIKVNVSYEEETSYIYDSGLHRKIKRSCIKRNC